MAQSDKPGSSGTGTSSGPQSSRQIVTAALKSGVIDTKQSIDDLVRKVGADIDEVAGYVLAWERYVLVVASELDTPVVSFKRR